MSNIENVKTLDILENIKIIKVKDLVKLPDTQQKDEIVEDGEIEHGKTILESQEAQKKLKEFLNLPNVDGITIKKPENIKQNGELVGVEKLRLDEIIHMGQKLSITPKFSINKNGKKINVVWGKSNRGEMTYIIEGTKKRVTINNGDKIQAYDEKINDITLKEQLNKKTDGFKPPIISAPIYVSENGITLCSKTARENLQKLGVKNVKQGGSAKESFKKYGKKAEKFPPSNGAKVFDLYCDATPKNREYGHRSVGVKINGEWMVLDPYYNKTKKPVPAEQYLSKMIGKGRRIWGGFSVG